MTHSKINTKSKGFTLIELLVVVAIIGVLAAVGVVAFQGFISKSKLNTCNSNFSTVSKYVGTTILQCETQGGVWPFTETNQEACNVWSPEVLATQIGAHINYMGFRNPYDGRELVLSGSDPSIGGISIHSPSIVSKEIYVTSCCQDDCWGAQNIYTDRRIYTCNTCP